MTQAALTWPDDAFLPPPALTRLIGAIIAKEVGANRRMDGHQLRPDRWTSETQLLDTGLALDSLERVNCAAALNGFFHLSDYGAEDYLLAAQTLGEWACIVAISLSHGSQQLTFETSGSTGAPKACVHSFESLTEEAQHWAADFSDIRQIVALVPPYHIYGFLWTVLLPALADVPVVDARFASASALKEALAPPGTLVVGAPLHWQYIARSFLSLPRGVHGVTSAAPMSAQLAQQLEAQGLETLTHVYGSSETGAIGVRCAATGPYALLPYWAFDETQEDLRLTRGGESAAQPMDTLVPLCGDAFELRGRTDGAVQVGGENVFPQRVAARIEEHADVAACSVRLCEDSQRLSAFVVPAAPGVCQATLETELRALCADELRAAERPTRFSFGADVPRTALGKVARW
ncbi:MAG: AMP-binding protein [Pseudomonadota bacterium]